MNDFNRQCLGSVAARRSPAVSVHSAGACQVALPSSGSSCSAGWVEAAAALSELGTTYLFPGAEAFPAAPAGMFFGANTVHSLAAQPLTL